MDMANKTIKKNISNFYKELSLIRAENKFSRSMDFLEKDSDEKLKNLIKSIDFSNKSISDIGGCDGSFIFKLSEENQLFHSTKVTLVDISPHYLRKAKEDYRKGFKNKFQLKTLISDVDDLKIKNRFDIVFFRSILEHLYFPDNSLKNLNNSLKVNGLLFIVTPNKNRLNEFIKRFIPQTLNKSLKVKLGTDSPKVIIIEKKYDLKEHIKEYSLDEIRNLLAIHSFEIIKEDYSSIPFIVPSICDRYDIIYYLQKIVIRLMNYSGLNKFLGFEYIILARKK